MKRSAAALCALFLVACSSSASSPTAAGPSAASPSASAPSTASPSASAPSTNLDAYTGVDYDDVNSLIVLHIYPPGDEMCEALDLSSACYQMVQPDKAGDLGAQGSAAMEDGLVALTVTLCAYCAEGEVGSTQLFEPREGGFLYSLRCEPEAAPCPDRGASYKRQG